MIGFDRSTVSPCSSIAIRSTPWVDGCCGPMLMSIGPSSGAAATLSIPSSTSAAASAASSEMRSTGSVGRRMAAVVVALIGLRLP